MPIPLLIGVAVGAVGLYKAGKAISDNSTADDVNESAQSIVNKAEERLERSRTECKETLDELGKRKADILRINIKNFIDVFKQIYGRAELAEQQNIDNFDLKEFDYILQEMQENISFIISSGLGVGGGVASGAITAFGAYSATMAFATASTGTAISSLSGAAATNATLAWLGGGSIAAGGGGVAAGTLALGALAAGPALLVAGWYMGAKAEEKLNDAYSNKAQAEKYAADVRAANAVSNGIRDVARKGIEILSQLSKHSRRNLNELKKVIEEQGKDYSKYDKEAKDIVMKNAKITQVIKAAIETPILDKEGNLIQSAADKFNQLKFDIEKTEN
ncbi:hypothetical protein [Rappaport israeli]|uniref:hypothetical protein n=1 Tax=Rappaport israeli TaxID=1839807 RepID=UPI000930A334|nr:hypothetical protein [Rappaport israeli]